MFARHGRARGPTTLSARIRDAAVELHLPLAEHLARRFAHRGEPLDDLVQVATIGLIKAIDRFDFERGVEFSDLRDADDRRRDQAPLPRHGWAVRVPRRLQELRLALTRANGDLSQSSSAALPHRPRARRMPRRRRGRRDRGARGRRKRVLEGRWTRTTTRTAPAAHGHLGYEDARSRASSTSLR